VAQRKVDDVAAQPLGGELERGPGARRVLEEEINDRATAQQFMPTNTRELTTQEGVAGFVYSFSTELADEFTLFAYYDGANYQVQVVKPEVAALFTAQ